MSEYGPHIWIHKKKIIETNAGNAQRPFVGHDEGRHVGARVCHLKCIGGGYCGYRDRVVCVCVCACVWVRVSVPMRVRVCFARGVVICTGRFDLRYLLHRCVCRCVCVKVWVGGCAFGYVCRYLCV